MKELIYILLFLSIPGLAQTNYIPTFKGTYFGQKPPGIIPEVFAKDIISKKCGIYANVVFNNHLNEAFWTPNNCDDTLYNGGIFYSNMEHNKWSDYKEIRFLDENFNHRSPFYAYDDNRLYFQTHKRKDQGWDQFEKFYFVEKINNEWSKPVLVDTIFNKYSVHWQFSLDKAKNLYFGGKLRGSQNSGGVYYSKFINGVYAEPTLIFSNSDYGEAVFAPAISPDSDYILFARIHPRGSSNPRIFSIYISFRKGELEWTEPQDLGEKLLMDGNQPRISPDGRLIFFVGNDGFSYWISANIIEELKPKY